MFTITAGEQIDKGCYLDVQPNGKVHKCTSLDFLTDPLGDVHSPHIIGFATSDAYSGDDVLVCAASFGFSG
jgi:hypothetical protein